MKKLFVALVVGSLLVGGAVKAAPDYLIPCTLFVGGANAPCPSLYVDSDTGVDTLYGDALEMNYIKSNFTINSNVIKAEEIGGPYVWGDYGYFTALEGVDLTFNSATIGQIAATSLNVVQYVKSAIGDFVTLTVGNILSFSNNAYASIRAYTYNLAFNGSTFVFKRWDGKGSCFEGTTMPGANPTKTVWSWFDNNGELKSTTSLAGVPTQCRTNN